MMTLVQVEKETPSMTFVRVLAARRCSSEDESRATAVADVELDAALSVRGVEIVDDSVRGGSVALAPRRPWGDHGRVLAWSDRVSQAIVQEVGRLLAGDERAVVGDIPADLFALLLPPERPERMIDGVPERLIPSAELPGGRRAAPGRVDADQLAAAIAAEPGITRAALADLLDVGRDAIANHAGALLAEGRIEAELTHVRGWAYYPAAETP